MKKPRIAITPCDDRNYPYFQMLENSLRKFHTEEELPLLRIENPTTDPNFWYLATPLLANKFLEEYETVIKIDCDTVVTGKLDHIWREDFDVATVRNSNPRDFQNFSYQFMNIPPLEYINNGLVVMKNPEFVKHWLKLCQSWIFPTCQMREQDLLNIMCLQDYKIRNLDEGKRWHGLISKGYWPQIELDKDILWLSKNEEWPTDEDKQIVAIHAGGGDDPGKMNFKLHFKPEVAKYLEGLVK